MKKVKYIVDNYKEEQTEGGYRIIRDEELEQEGVDGVIISTYVYREQVLQSLSKKNSQTLQTRPCLKKINHLMKKTEKTLKLF